ncbi:MAG TPA: DUF6481 family protein [Sphingomicrobium sp.]|jgi:hypothetical protein|nr:DUF6481 family protein [Sphingomicrobium sp.]
MKSYKDPSFQDRVGRAAEAKQKALEQLKAKPAPDPKLVAARVEANARREAAKAEKLAARKASELAAKEAAAAKVAADAKAAPLSEAELKAKRDARYAARKKRK